MHEFGEDVESSGYLQRRLAEKGVSMQEIPKHWIERRRR